MQIGNNVGPYRILRHLGSGGMGSVWLAEDLRLHRQVALKTLRGAADDDAQARARLMREARAAAALNHPHIATVYDVLEEAGQVVIVFEYVEGETLAARLARDPLPAPEAVEIGCQIAKALVVAHAQGIVHRDLKPANVIVTAGGQAKVLDFGIARMLATGTTRTKGGYTASAGGFIGTPAYAAPEQMVSSAVDERADLYALGVMLFEMISGRRPFMGSDPVALASSKLSHDAPVLKSRAAAIPRELEHLVASLLARDRDDRPATAGDVLSQLRAIYGTTGTGSLALPSAPRRLVSMIAGVILLAAVAGFGAWEIRRMAGAETPSNTSPPVVVVLPLSNVSGDSARDFVAAGIAESLISSLATLPSVTVLSRASVSEAQRRIKDQRALSKELGATYFVEGSLQESGGTLRVSLNLVRPDRSVAWGDSLEGRFDRIFELQSRLAAMLSSALSVQASAAERQRMTAPPTDNAEALAAYWLGTALLERVDVKGNVDASISAFGSALRTDARFSLAHAGLSRAYRQKYFDTRDGLWAQRAVDEATNALRLDPDRAEVRYVLALTLSTSGRLDEAVEELNRALGMQPNYEDARRQLGLVLADQGHVDAAVAEFRKAIALRPNAAGPYNAMGLVLLRASRYVEAVAAFEQAVRIAPDTFTGYQQLGTAYQFLGRTDEALDNYRKANLIRPSAGAFSNIGAILHEQGDYAGAVEAYQKSIEIRPNSAPTHRNLGDALIKMGRSANARAAYREAVRLGEADLKVNPSDPRLLAAQAVYLQKAGDEAAALNRLNLALATAPDNGEVLYRAGIVMALRGDREQALSLLERAVQKGYSREQIRLDDDLASLRVDARFKQLSTLEAR